MRYKGTVPFEEWTFPIEPDSDDFAWATTDPKVQRRFTGLVVVVRQRHIWGVGKTDRQALVDAMTKPNCPKPEELETILVPGMLLGPSVLDGTT